jgi:hypothetical protein
MVGPLPGVATLPPKFPSWPARVELSVTLIDGTLVRLPSKKNKVPPPPTVSTLPPPFTVPSM